MAFRETIDNLKNKSKAIGEKVDNQLLKMRNSKVAEKYSRYADMLLYSRETSKRMEDIKDRFYYPTNNKRKIYTNEYASKFKPTHIQRELAFKNYLKNFSTGRAPSYDQILGKEPWKKDKVTGDYHYMNKPPGQQIVKDRRGATPNLPTQPNIPQKTGSKPQPPTFVPDRSFTGIKDAPASTVEQNNQNIPNTNSSGSDKIIKTLSENHSESLARYKIMTTHLNMQTELLKKIEINTRNNGDMLDLFKKNLQKKPTPRGKTPTPRGKTPTPRGKTPTPKNNVPGGITAEKRVPNSKPIPLKERAKNFIDKAKNIKKSGGMKTMSAIARGAKTFGAVLTAGRVAGTLGTLGTAAAVLGAGAVGAGVGTLLSKALPDGVKQAIGKGVAQAASFFGSNTKCWGI